MVFHNLHMPIKPMMTDHESTYRSLEDEDLSFMVVLRKYILPIVLVLALSLSLLFVFL